MHLPPREVHAAAVGVWEEHARFCEGRMPGRRQAAEDALPRGKVLVRRLQDGGGRPDGGARPRREARQQVQEGRRAYQEGPRGGDDLRPEEGTDRAVDGDAARVLRQVHGRARVHRVADEEVRRRPLREGEVRPRLHRPVALARGHRLRRRRVGDEHPELGRHPLPRGRGEAAAAAAAGAARRRARVVRAHQDAVRGLDGLQPGACTIACWDNGECMPRFGNEEWCYNAAEWKQCVTKDWMWCRCKGEQCALDKVDPRTSRARRTARRRGEEWSRRSPTGSGLRARLAHRRLVDVPAHP